MGSEVRMVVPLVPPSVNHYKMRSRNGHWYVNRDALAFKEAVVLEFRRSRRASDVDLVGIRRYELEAIVWLGFGQRGDGDNFWKVLADALVEAGAIHSDAAVSDWIMRVRRDRANPRTEIIVRAAQQE